MTVRRFIISPVTGTSVDRHYAAPPSAVQGDVAKAADVEKIFAKTKQAFGRLDILVNNAGVYNLLPLEEITEEDFHRHFNINVLGLLLATRRRRSSLATKVAASSISAP